MFNNFQAWKLHTVGDYLFFAFMVAFCAAFIYITTKRINRRRNNESAVARVAKKFKVKNGSGVVYNNATFDLSGEKLHFDHLLLDADGIVVAKSIGWGIRIYGSAEESSWKVTDNKRDDLRIDNPVKAVEATFEPLRKFLSSGGVYNVTLIPLAVFADPFAPVELYLGRDSCCITYEGIKPWLKSRALRAKLKNDRFDFAAAKKLLDSAMIAEEKSK